MFWNKKGDFTPDENEKRERLFFHDLINQTHGLILFFTQRQNQNIDIPACEIGMLLAEVRTLQSLIKDHFNYKHKDLSSTYDWVPFSVAEISLNGLIKTYLPAQKASTYIHLSGDLSYEQNLEVRERALIYYPAFYRIMNNLIKNMSEANSPEVHFLFGYQNNLFTIETRNKFNRKEDLQNLSDKLSQIILEEKISKSGLGLESIHYLALENGGVFDFEIANDFWINRISLPSTPEENKQKKAA